jgi:mannose-6-phosphate isomerase
VRIADGPTDHSIDYVRRLSLSTRVAPTSPPRSKSLSGVEDLVVVATDDAGLVARRENGDGLRRLVRKIKKVVPTITEEHFKVHRPWGSYQSIDYGERFQVKRIVVKKGGRLSLRMHQHCAELAARRG